VKKIYRWLMVFLALTGTLASFGVQALSAVPIDVSAAHPGKPGAQVMLVDNQVYRLEIGVEKTLNLKLISAYSQGEMQVRISASEGLALQQAAEKISFMLEEGKVYEIPLQISAMIAGRHYVHLHIDVTVGNRKMFKSVSAIIQAQSAFEEPRLLRGAQKAGVNENNTGEEVISLPAQEKILIHQHR